MIYECTEKGIEALRGMAQNIKAASADILDHAQKLKNAGDSDNLGPHAGSVAEAGEMIEEAILGAVDPVLDIAESLNMVAEGYEDVINNNRIQSAADGSGAAGIAAVGIAAGIGAAAGAAAAGSASSGASSGGASSGGAGSGGTGGSSGLTGKQAARQAAEAWKETLTSEEKRSITDYTGEMPNYYRNINSTLRGKSPAFDPGNAERASHIHEALQKASLPQTMTVYRRGSNSILGSLEGKSDQELVGSAFRDKGFISTAMSPEATLPGNTMLVIQVPAGSKAACIESISQAGKIEEEVLIDNDQVFVITGVRREGSSRIVEAVMMKKK